MVSGSKGTPWSDRETEILSDNYFRMSPVELQGRYFPYRTLESIRMKAKKLGLRRDLRPRVYSPAIEFKDMRARTPEDLERFFEVVKNFQDSSVGLSTRMDEVVARIDTGEPIIVAMLSDAHVGALTTNHRGLEERINLIADTDRCYVVSCGDTVDNYLPKGKHNNGMLSAIIPPALQKDIVELLYGRLKGKLLGVVQGCHDEWSHDQDDFDWSSYLAKYLGCPNMGFGGFLDLTVGQVLYRFGIRHKYRYNSSFNMTHVVKRMREQFGDFDVGVVSHHHQASYEHLAMPDKDRVFIRPGSFKGVDRYARQMGYRDTGHQVPSVVLDPVVRKITPFMNLADAVRFLDTY